MWVSKDAPAGENTNLSSLVLYQLADTAEAVSYLTKNTANSPTGFTAYTKYKKAPKSIKDYEDEGDEASKIVNFAWLGKPILPSGATPKSFWLAWLVIAYRRVTLAINSKQPHEPLMRSIQEAIYRTDPVPAVSRRATLLSPTKKSWPNLKTPNVSSMTTLLGRSAQ